MISEEENQGPSTASETASNDSGPAEDPSPQYAEDGPGIAGSAAEGETATIPAAPATVAPPPAPPAPPPAKGRDKDEEPDEEDEEEEMLRMSFLEHLEELRSRILKALAGVGIAFLFSIIFADELWKIISEPAVEALTRLGYENTKLAQIKPMEAFTTVWVKLPILTAIFLASPWVLYQVWAFIAPGLYRRERRWAAPFVIFSAGLFILGGLFAYFVAFRFGLTFLLGIGRNINIAPVVSITEYFDLFVNVTLGIGLVFQLPVLIFFLTLLRITTPGFLLRNARYAVLIIVIVAAIVTPTPDVVNLMLFSVPMCLLYFVGIFAGYLLELRRARRRFPWRVVWMILGGLLLVAAAAIFVAVTRFGYHLAPHWPFLVR